MITYEIGTRLYLNITNQCTNQCSFCVRKHPEGLGLDLWLKKEPEINEIIEAVGTAKQYNEIIFCGYGEPMIRLHELLETAKYLKKLHKKVRIDTNGQADKIWNRPVAAELSGLIDSVSISLNAADELLYHELCRSKFGPGIYGSILSFARDCVKYIPEVTLSVVDIISESEIEKCALIAKNIGADFRVRPFIK
jgi:TatD family-associated radical SAM protein